MLPYLSSSAASCSSDPALAVQRTRYAASCAPRSAVLPASHDLRAATLVLSFNHLVRITLCNYYETRISEGELAPFLVSIDVDTAESWPSEIGIPRTVCLEYTVSLRQPAPQPAANCANSAAPGRARRTTSALAAPLAGVPARNLPRTPPARGLSLLQTHQCEWARTTCISS